MNLSFTSLVLPYVQFPGGTSYCVWIDSRYSTDPSDELPERIAQALAWCEEQLPEGSWTFSDHPCGTRGRIFRIALFRFAEDQHRTWFRTFAL
jgi:hypothetical protein